MATSPIPVNRTDDTLRVWARYDGNKRLIPGSMAARRTPPKGNNWVEIPSNLCCTETTTLTPT